MSAVAAHLPALQVVVPLLGSVLVAFLRGGRAAFTVTLIVSWLMPFIAGALLWQVLQSGPISYAIGGWEPPWGIEYRVDLLSGFVLVLVSAIGAVTIPFAYRSVASEIPGSKRAWFYCMYLLCLTGLLGIVITGDAFNAFVFLEISSLSTYVLIALGRDRRALLSAFQYLIVGTIGATFYVIGVGFLYLLTGSLNMVDVAARLGTAWPDQSPAIVAALAFITVGVSMKLALFPLHAWLPNAYAYAPSWVTAFLSATATKVAIYLLIRFYFSVFGVAIDFRALPIADIIVALSVAAMVIASLIAVFETNLKRMLAYSSVAQIGYITLGIGLADQAGLTGGLVHIVNHAVMKAALFLAAGAIVYRIGTVNIADLAGIGRKMPFTMAAFTIAGIRSRRHPWHRRLYLQMVPRRRRTGQRLVAAGVRHRGKLADRARLCRPSRRDCVDARTLSGGRASERPTAVHAASDRRPRRRDDLFRHRHRMERGYRQFDRQELARGAAMTAAVTSERLILLALFAPFVGALLIPLFRKLPNLRETVTLVTAGILCAAVFGLLAPVLDGARPEVMLIEVTPALVLALKVEPLGMLFALVASVLWVVNSIYSIGYMRANEEPRQTGFYVCFAIALGSTIGIAFAKNLFTLFLFYEALTIATYPLVTHKGNAEAIRAGRIYLLLLLGTSLVLFLPAIIATWVLAGTLDFTPGGILDGKAGAPVIALLLALYVFGIGKAAVMPMHFWLPAAMVAPTPVSALLHAVAVVKAGVFTVAQGGRLRIRLRRAGKHRREPMAHFRGVGEPDRCLVDCTVARQSEGTPRLFDHQPACLCGSRCGARYIGRTSSAAAFRSPCMRRRRSRCSSAPAPFIRPII